MYRTIPCQPHQPADPQAQLHYTPRSRSLSLTRVMRPDILRWTFVVCLGLLLVLLAACRGAEPETQTPGIPTASPSVASPIAEPTPTKTLPTNTPPPPLALEVLTPADQSGIEVGFVRVMGTTSGTSVVVNGLEANLSEAGDFQQDVDLRGGVNILEVVASDDAGQTASQQIVVFLVDPTAGLPFTLLYPLDGQEVSEPSITVLGVTLPDAVVGVNDIPAEVDGSGIFSVAVDLEEGPNLLEVVAADFEGNVRFQTSVVFYLP